MEQIERLETINKVLKPRTIKSKRGRFPTYRLKALDILMPCKGYENGITIGDFSKKLYGEDTTDNRINSRQQIAQVRKYWSIYIYSIKPMGISGAERRYCHLQDPDEFQQVISGYKYQMVGKDGKHGIEGWRKDVVNAKRRKKNIKQLERVTVKA